MYFRCNLRKFEHSSRADETAESHIPTADKVSRVFSSTHPHLFDNSLFEIEEGIEEVNFEDLALVHDRVLNSVPPTVQGNVSTYVGRNPALEPEVQRERTSGVTLTAEAEPPDGHTMKTITEATITTAEPEPAKIPTEPSPLFFIDTNPSTSRMQIPVPVYHVHPHAESLGENVQVEVEPDPEDDVIVYDAPNPRISTPKVEPSALMNISLSSHGPSPSLRQINPLRRGRFVHVVGRNARRGSSGGVGIKRKRLAEHKNFATFGAMIAEARLRSQDVEEDRDPKEHLRRQGDSDLDWGDETDEGEKGAGPVAATAEGMDLDPDLVGSGVMAAAMERFVEGINGNHVTMNDLEDVNATDDSPSDSDEEGESEGGSEDQHLESQEERMLMEEFIAGQYGSDFSDDDDEDDELNPMAGFQARLDRLRRKQQKIIEMEDDEDEDDMDQELQWDEAEGVEVCIIHVLRLQDLHATPRTSLKELSINTKRTGRRATRFSGRFRMGFSTSWSPKLLRQVSGEPLGQRCLVLMTA